MCHQSRAKAGAAHPRDKPFQLAVAALLTLLNATKNRR
jgi:hypothetical protein